MNNSSSGFATNVRQNKPIQYRFLFRVYHRKRSVHIPSKRYKFPFVSLKMWDYFQSFTHRNIISIRLIFNTARRAPGTGTGMSSRGTNLSKDLPWPFPCTNIRLTSARLDPSSLLLPHSRTVGCPVRYVVSSPCLRVGGLGSLLPHVAPAMNRCCFPRLLSGDPDSFSFFLQSHVPSVLTPHLTPTRSAVSPRGRIIDVFPSVEVGSESRIKSSERQTAYSDK